MRTRVVLIVAIVTAIAAEAAGRGAREAAPPLAPLLSATGLYASGSTSVVRPGNVPFAPQYPLWSDGSSKQRWIYVPPGTSIDASHPDAFEFPPGTKLWKEFSHAQRVETRLIERMADGSWRFATYVWNEERSDAKLAPEEGVAAIVVDSAPGRRYDIPSRADCLACHEGGTVPVLGFSALQLSPDRDPRAPHAESPRGGEASLADFVARGMIRGLPQSMLDSPPRIPAASAVERAALGYLHGNCGHCHNATGGVAGIDLVLAQRAADSNASAREALASLIGHDSRFRTNGAAAARVAPGRAEHSVIALRLRSTNPMTRMPPLGVTVVDKSGLAIVERWINEYLQRTTETTQ